MNCNHTSQAYVQRSRAPISVAIQCGVPTVTQRIVAHLESLSFHCHAAASLCIIYDTPIGFAPATLGTLKQVHPRQIVVTRNSCAEYLDDLWEMRPTIMLSQAQFSDDIPTTIMRATHGDHYRVMHGAASPLTAAERRTLRLLAHGYSARQVAAELHVQYQTVRNTLTAIYQKLDLHNHIEAVLYYWGILPMIRAPFDALAASFDDPRSADD